MATEVDNKVVSMRFDNSQFERNVQKSIGTLQRLRDSLNLDKSAKSLTNLESKINSLDVSGVNRATQAASKAFSSFGAVGFSVVNRLTNDIINLGRSITANLTKPIREGMQTYEQQIKATQTTMNALNLKGQKGEEKVRYYLKDLNKYSDETIYRFSDMTTSLSKFVSAGVNINDATEAIKGLGNVAALSGADTMQFSRAIYNISQSLGMGKMITRDWMSIENANMATKEFKETLIDTAKKMGYIDKQGKLTQKGLAGVNRTQQKAMASMNISYKNFRDSLSGGWLKNDVLMAALKRYADETDTLGKKGKAAATEVKTFSQLLDTLGDSLATKWANIYTDIVGDFNEAKDFWTKVSGVLETLLVKPLDEIEKVTSKWKELGGRDTVLRSMEMQLNGFRTALNSIKSAWEVVFPKGTQLKVLQAVTKAFQNFSYILSGFSIKAAMPLAHIMLGLASAIKIVLKIVQGIAQILAPIVKLAGQVTLAIFKILGAIGDLIFGVSNLNTKLTPFQIVAKGVSKVCELLGKAVNFVADAFVRLTHLSFGWPKGTETAVKKAEETQKKANPFLKFFQALGGFLVRVAKTIGGAISQVFNGLAKGFSSLNHTLDDSSLTPIEKLYTIVNMIFSGALMTNVVKGITTFNKGFKSFGDILKNFGELGYTFNEAIKRLSKALSKNISSFANQRNAEALKSFAIAVAILAGSLVLISAVDPDRLLTSVAAIAGLVGILAGVMALMTKLTKVGKGFNNLVSLFAPNQQQAIAKAMISMSVAVLILSASLAVLGQLNIQQLVQGGIAVAGLMMLLVGVAKLMQQQKGFFGAAIGLDLMAAAVSSLTKSLLALSTIPINQLKQGGIALAGIMTLLAAISKWLGKGKALGGMASMAFMNIAMAMNMLIKPIQVFGAMKTDEIAKGLITLGIALAAITLALKAVSKNAGMILVFGLALTAMAPGLIAFAGALKIISSIDTGSLVASVAAIGSLFAMLAIVGSVMAKMPLMIATIPVLAASFLILAPAVMTLSAAFLVFSQCNWTGILGGVVAIAALAAVMTTVGVVMATNKWLMLTMPILAASMLILAPAIITLSAAFAVFSKCDWTGVLVGITAIAGIAAIFTVVSLIMANVPLMIATMPVLAISLNLLAPAILTISAAFVVFNSVKWAGVAKGVVGILGVIAVVTLVAGIMSIFPLMIATFPVLAVTLLILAPAILTIAGAFVVFNSVKWGAVGKGIVTMLGLVGLMAAMGAVITIFPKLILGMGAFAVLLAVLSKLFGALDAVNMTNLGEAFVILCNKIADGAKVLADAGKKYKDGIHDISEAVKTAGKVATTNYAAAYMRAGQELMKSLTAGVTSQKAFFTSGVMTVTNSINRFLPSAKLTAYNAGAQIGGNLINGFRGPRGLDDPPEESKATKKGLKTMNSTIGDAKSYLIPTANNTGSITGTSLANSFNTSLDEGTNEGLAQFDQKIAAAQKRASISLKAQNWLANHPDAVGKRVQMKTKNGNTDEWVKRGNHYYRYQNGANTGVFSKKDAKKFGLKIKSNKSNKNTPPIPYDTTPTTSSSIGGGGTSSGSGSGHNKGSSSKKKNGTIKVGPWGNKSGYKPEKNGIWSYTEYFKGFNRYQENSKNQTAIFAKYDKKLDRFLKYQKKIDNNTDPKPWTKSAYIKKVAGVATGYNNSEAKRLKSDLKMHQGFRDKYLSDAAYYSDKADHAKSKKTKKKYNTLSQKKLRDAEFEETIIGQDKEQLKNYKNKDDYTKVGKIIGDVWADSYGDTAEYKQAKKRVESLNKDANKQKDKLKFIKSERKKVIKDEKKYKNATTSAGKARYEAAKKYYDYLKNEEKTATDKLKKHGEEISKLSKTIKNGPHEAFNKMYKDVSKNLKDALKMSTLFAKDSSENIWEHFTYSGTKKEFESGKQAWRYAGYGKTQNEHYANLKADRDYILAREDLSDEFKEYVIRNWRDLGNEMHAFRYGTLADQKQIDLNYQQKVKNDHDSAYSNYKEKIAEAKKWASNIQKLARLGFNGKALKQLIDNGFSEDNVALTETMIDLLQNGTEQEKKDVLDLGTSIAGSEKDSIIASIMTSETYAKASPERQKELREALGWTEENNEIMQQEAMTDGENAAKAYNQGIKKYSIIDGNTGKALKNSVLTDDWYSYIGSLIPDGKTLSKGVVDAINAINSDIDNWISGGETQAGKKSSNMVKTICKVMNDVADKDAPEVGKMLIQGLINGTLDHQHRAELNAAAEETGRIAPDTVKKILGINSPSKVFYEIGQYILEGLTNGLSDTSSVEKAAQKSAKAVLKGFGVINQIGTENITPTVAPVVDQDSFNAVTTQLGGFITDTSAQLANQIQYQLDTNKAIQNFNAQVDYDDSNLIAEIESLHSDMMQLQNVIASMQVTIDSGALVGQIAPQIDRTLGQRATMGRR